LYSIYVLFIKQSRIHRGSESLGVRLASTCAVSACHWNLVDKLTYTCAVSVYHRKLEVD